MFQDLSVPTCSTIKVSFKELLVLFLGTCILQLTEKRILSMVYYGEVGTSVTFEFSETTLSAAGRSKC
jgi:hypothetical protein